MAEFLSSEPEVQDAHPHTVYDLIANICHDGQPGETNGVDTGKWGRETTSARVVQPTDHVHQYISEQFNYSCYMYMEAST